jgi:hypothetical protein
MQFDPFLSVSAISRDLLPMKRSHGNDKVMISRVVTKGMTSTLLFFESLGETRCHVVKILSQPYGDAHVARN